MIKVKNANMNNIIQWYSKSTDIKKGQLLKEDTGASPVAAEHSGATLLGVALEDQDTANSIVYIYPLQGTVLEIDYYASATKQSLAVTNLGTQYDMNVDGTTGEMTVNLDDTSSGFLYLVGYDNDNKKGYFVVADADILLSV